MKRLTSALLLAALLGAGAAQAQQACDSSTGYCRDERSERVARWAAVDIRNFEMRQQREARLRYYDDKKRHALVNQLNGLIAQNRCDEAQALAASKPWEDIRARVDAHCEAAKARS